MDTVKVRDVEIGAGIPKVCVSVIEKRTKGIVKSASNIKKLGADLIEWRADWFQDIFDRDEMLHTLERLRGTLGNTPLLFAFRTGKEGGAQKIDPQVYVKINKRAIQSGYIDMVDIELFTGEAEVAELVRTAKECGVKIVMSNHDFNKTPEKRAIIGRLRLMQELGADIAKIAVMPQSKKDVLILLDATEEMNSRYANRPIVTMSMSGMGVLSRLCGEVFGSAMTFGAAGQASAPGQMEVEDLKTVLRLIHKGM
ncbi:MAG: type I 3-dehydroquinate dehydratase [Schaedlerella sp.]|nr:type I 3-dehydroquinate dehydratase [Schaedlerella sp.]